MGERNVRKFLPLACPSPTIVRAIADDVKPPDIVVERRLRCRRLDLHEGALACGRLLGHHVDILRRAAGPGWDALNCRDGGKWRTEFLAAKASPTTGYAPASSDTSIAAFLGERGAEPVPPGEESKVLGMPPSQGGTRP